MSEVTEVATEINSPFKTGTIKWFNAYKAYGFISLPEGGMDVFIHSKQLRASGITRFPVEGDQVKFRISNGNKGQYAIDISVVAPVQEG